MRRPATPEVAIRLPLLVAGAGALGGALIAGLLRAGSVSAADLVINDPQPRAETLRVAATGARLNPPPEVLGEARTVILAVKPQGWREMAAILAPHLHSDALVISAMAGVPARQVAEAFAPRRVARAMPTLGVAVLKGATAVWARDAENLDQAAAVFSPLGAVVRLADEDQLHAVTAASGSGPAYLYAVIEAVEAAARAQGLTQSDAAVLARGAIIGAAALLGDSRENPAELRKRVTSPGGTTEAAMTVLFAPEGLLSLMERAVAAATARSRELAP